MKKYIPQILLTVIPIFFFLKLIFPAPSTFTTPDFGRSDALHQNLPYKLELSNDLKSLTLPLMENSIGHGYPLVAEGIIATFYLPNVILFTFFPFSFAMPLMYISTFMLTAFGMYLLLRSCGLSKLPSVFSALSFTFCASFMLHVQHFNYLQGASLIPWIAFCLKNFLQKKKIRYLLLLVFLCAQQILAGFVQLSAYSILIVSLVWLGFVIRTKKSLKSHFIAFIAFIALTFGLAAVQLIPSFELINYSTRNEGLTPTYILNSFPIKPSNLLTLINPFILGKASDGTYNNPDLLRNGIYWESTAYIGLLPFLFSCFSVLALVKQKKSAYYICALLLFVLTLALALGKYSPLHLLYSIPPLSFFRVPSRFLLLAQFFLTIMAAFGMQALIDSLKLKTSLKSALGYTFIFALTVDIFFNWLSYNPIEKIESILNPPPITNYIKNKAEYRIFTIGQYKTWNEEFTTRGWQNPEKYVYLRNSQDHNLNMLYDTNQLQFFETLLSDRYSFLMEIIHSGINTAPSAVEIDDTSLKLLNYFNVGYLISTIKLNSTHLHTKAALNDFDTTYFLYELKDKQQIAKIYTEYKVASTKSDYIRLIKENDLANTLIIEKQPPVVSTVSKDASVNIVEVKDGYFKMETKSSVTSLLALKIAPVPGWKAYVDNKQTEIYPANINSQFAVIAPGFHTVEFIYKPNSFKLGTGATLITYFLLFAVYKNRNRLKHF